MWVPQCKWDNECQLHVNSNMGAKRVTVKTQRINQYIVVLTILWQHDIKIQDCTA